MLVADPAKKTISEKIHAGVRLTPAEFKAAWDDAELWGQFSIAFETRRAHLEAHDSPVAAVEQEKDISDVRS